MDPIAFSRGVRFGGFEVDLVASELRKRGRRIPLQEQPFQVLALLVRRAGELVTREELQQALWPAGTVIEFEHGVNTAVKKVRQALGDDADNPVFSRRSRARVTGSSHR
jgi:cholera toxin transcriptional activator